MPTRTHGFTGSRIYNTWLNIKQRCLNQNYKRYKDYGGRGISISEDWINDFSSFQKWSLENGYSNTLTIDRKDVNGNYCPENCRWITNADQQLNRRDNHVLSFNGESKTISEWAKVLGVSSNCISSRLKDGWSIEKALTIPAIDKRIDIVGRKFGRITVVSFSNVNHGANWNCVCDCGKIKVIRGSSLITGVTQSCGCIQKELAAKTALKSSEINSIPICQYDLKGNFVSEFLSINEASRITGISYSNIQMVVCKTEYKPNKIRKQAGGYIWKLKEEICA